MATNRATIRRLFAVLDPDNESGARTHDERLEALRNSPQLGDVLEMLMGDGGKDGANTDGGATRRAGTGTRRESRQTSNRREASGLTFDAPGTLGDGDAYDGADLGRRNIDKIRRFLDSL